MPHSRASRGGEGADARLVVASRTVSRWRGLTAIVVVAVFFLVAVAASFRQLHVDEFHNVYTMQLASVFGHPDYADPLELFHVLGSLVSRCFDQSLSMFAALRQVFGAIFVVLLVALARAQPFFTDARGRLAALVGSAAFWPAWRHGFEIRHDVLLALGVVALYVLTLGVGKARSHSARWTGNDSSAAIAGFVAALMQLNSHKAMTLWGPALLVIAVLAGRRAPSAPWRAAVRAVGLEAAGAAAGVALGFLAFAVVGAPGTLAAYVDRLVHFAAYASGAYRFSPLPILEHIATRATVATSLALLFLGVACRRLVRRQATQEELVTLVFFGATLLALVVNPTPFPYNLVWVAPAVILAAAGGARVVVDALASRIEPTRLGMILVLAAAVQAMACAGTDRFMRKGQALQREVIDAAEQLTAPDEPVFDAAGLVPSRPPASRYWILHSLFMDEYRAGRRETVRQIIEREAPPVMVRGHYRFDWLGDDDLHAIDESYIPVSKQVWVLGARVDAPQARVAIRRAGRYVLEVPGGGSGAVDGAAVAPGAPLALAVGPHEVEAPIGSRLVWVGPRLFTPPALRSSNSRLFPPILLKPR